MKKEIMVKVENVKKSFHLPTESTSSLKRTMVNYFKGIKGYREQKVLRDISFEVNRGDFIGIVGRNGSGKSTLLKIISQIYQPETGKVTINGKLVSFIELGVGFNPELTGKENVYLNGALLGFSTKEVDAMYDDIVDFAELHEFMNQKLKNYSSGMQVRLAFSVAIRVNSDILVLDEVLAVGDEAFQRKCNDYFMNAKEQEKTIILVTHSMEAVRKYCNKALLIDKGEIKVIGTPDEVANQYSLDNLFQSGAATVIDGDANQEKHVAEQIVEENPYIADLKVELLSTTILKGMDREIRFKISYTVLQNMKTYIAFSLTDIDRNVWLYNDNSLDFLTEAKSGKQEFFYSCRLDNINQCKLKLVVSIRDEMDQMLDLANAENTPMIVIKPKEGISESERDSSSGILTRNGIWNNKIMEE